MNESVDEDLCQRLVGQRLPSVRLPSTAGGIVDLAAPSTGRTVIYCYPRTSEPGKPAPTDWDLIPGARGCTPQACTFRDHYQELRALGAEVFGLSTQTTAYQAEMSSRLHLPFAVLSDAAMRFTDALRLPTFMVDGMRLIKRLTIIARGPRIETVFYPIGTPRGECLRRDCLAQSESDLTAAARQHRIVTPVSTTRRTSRPNVTGNRNHMSPCSVRGLSGCFTRSAW